MEALQAHRARVGQTPYFPNEIRSSATNTALKLSLYAGVIAAGIPIRLDWNLVSARRELGEEKIRALLNGKRISGYLTGVRNAGFVGPVWWLDFKPDGRVEGRGRSDVVGRYVVEGGQLCFVWKQGIFELGRIDNECWKIYRYT